MLPTPPPAKPIFAPWQATRPPQTMFTLPEELGDEICTYLGVADLLRLERTSRAGRALVLPNYRRAYNHHGIIHRAPPNIADTSSWKVLCQEAAMFVPKVTGRQRVQHQIATLVADGTCSPATVRYCLLVLRHHDASPPVVHDLKPWFGILASLQERHHEVRKLNLARDGLAYPQHVSFLLGRCGIAVSHDDTLAPNWVTHWRANLLGTAAQGGGAPLRTMLNDLPSIAADSDIHSVLVRAFGIAARHQHQEGMAIIQKAIAQHTLPHPEYIGALLVQTFYNAIDHRRLNTLSALLAGSGLWALPDRTRLLVGAMAVAVSQLSLSMMATLYPAFSKSQRRRHLHGWFSGLINASERQRWIAQRYSPTDYALTAIRWLLLQPEAAQVDQNRLNQPAASTFSHLAAGYTHAHYLHAVLAADLSLHSCDILGRTALGSLIGLGFGASRHLLHIHSTHHQRKVTALHQTQASRAGWQNKQAFIAQYAANLHDFDPDLFVDMEHTEESLKTALCADHELGIDIALALARHCHTGVLMALTDPHIAETLHAIRATLFNTPMVLPLDRPAHNPVPAQRVLRFFQQYNNMPFKAALVASRALSDRCTPNELRLIKEFLYSENGRYYLLSESQMFQAISRLCWRRVPARIKNI
jgi:hypothetical protein